MKKIVYIITTALFLTACNKNIKTENPIDIVIDSTDKPVTLPAYRGLYVDGFNNILGDTAKENTLLDRKSTRLNSSHVSQSRMPSSA